MRPIRHCCPDPAIALTRVMVSSPSNARAKLKLGPWLDDNPISQYFWVDGTPLTNSSTAQVRSILVHQAAQPHLALRKWTEQLGRPIPDEVWQYTWMKFRSAAENTCLWQILYRILATQRWRYPERPQDDPLTWCSRCAQGITKDTLHCIWGCPVSRRCWEWGAAMLHLTVAPGTNRLRLLPQHVILAEPLPLAWDIPMKLWHSLRAILCWLIWKDRNGHIFDREASDSQRVIGLAWHRLGLYMLMAWRDIVGLIRRDRLPIAEARALMVTQYGPEGILWTLHEITLQVSPVPPRPH